MLLRRYHRAIELMDEKLRDFFVAARDQQLLDDTMVILTSDHGEGFGEHGLYLHDAALYETHLRVPLYVLHPRVAPAVVHDVVSMRDLFGLIRAAALGEPLDQTLLAEGYRTARPVALAEHFHYPHALGADRRYRQDIAAAICADRKLIVRQKGGELYDSAGDPRETAPVPGTVRDFSAALPRRTRATPSAQHALAHLRSWEAEHVGRAIRAGGGSGASPPALDNA
jgi:arylsulfatase A-like enzyme